MFGKLQRLFGKLQRMFGKLQRMFGKLQRMFDHDEGNFTYPTTDTGLNLFYRGCGWNSGLITSQTSLHYSASLPSLTAFFYSFYNYMVYNGCWQTCC